MTFSMCDVALILGRLTVRMESHLLFSKTASVLTPCLVKLFRLCLSTSNYPSGWKFASVQLFPK